MMTLQKPVDPVPAATMLLLRDEPEFQVLMVMRHHQTAFASGALVFPGGKPSAADAAPEWADFCRGWPQPDPTHRTLRLAHTRDGFEDTGQQLAHNRNSQGFEEIS